MSGGWGCTPHGAAPVEPALSPPASCTHRGKQNPHQGSLQALTGGRSVHREQHTQGKAAPTPQVERKGTTNRQQHQKQVGDTPCSTCSSERNLLTASIQNL